MPSSMTWGLHLQAIKSSSYVTQDLGSADLVFVDSHCYLIHRTAEIAYWPQERRDLVLGEPADLACTSWHASC